MDTGEWDGHHIADAGKLAEVSRYFGGTLDSRNDWKRGSGTAFGHGPPIH